MTKVTKFYSQTCKPCKTYGPIVDAVCNSKDIQVESIDVSDAPQLVAQYGIRSVPALVQGSKVLVGAKTPEELLAWLEEA